MAVDEADEADETVVARVTPGATDGERAEILVALEQLCAGNFNVRLRPRREVGAKGKLGGQAEVPGVAGTWRDLTENVNQLAGNLTTQVRAIAEVPTAVTRGDFTRSIAVDAQGEVAELKDNPVIETVHDTITANVRTEALLAQSRRLAQEPQAQSMELRRTNAELEEKAALLEEKAALLEEQNRNIEIQNREIEMARLGLQEKAEQLALSSQYKSELVANMSGRSRSALSNVAPEP